MKLDSLNRLSKAIGFRAFCCVGMFFLGGIVFVSAQSESAALSKITELQGLMSQAETKGIDTHKEKMTVRTAQIFLKYATYDANHVDLNKQFFDLRYPYPKAGLPTAPAIRPTTTELANNLPELLRKDVVTILDVAIAKMNKLLLPDAIIPPATPVVDWANVSVSGNKLMHNGKPVFLLEHSFKPDATELTDFYGNLDTFFITLSNLTNTSGSLGVSSSVINSLSSKPTGRIGHIFLSQNGIPSWLNTASNDVNSPYYGLVTTAPIFTRFDVDHPQARVLNSFLLSKTIPYMKGKNYSKLGYMLTNEPHWFTAEGSFDVVPISQYTKAKFVTWLTNKHVTVGTLNTIWGTSYATIEAAVADYPFPVPVNLQGTPKWYDWMTFNQYRITDWFKFLYDEVKKEDPNALNHLKLIPSEWSKDNHDHGLDFEALTEMSGIIGNDAGSVDSVVFGDTSKQTWMPRYDFNWRDFAMPFDFMRSVSPEKLVYNTESHFLSTSNFRDLNLSKDYTRATHWLATLHGMNAAQSWVWFRNEDGSYQNRLFIRNTTTGEYDTLDSGSANGYSASTLQLPIVLNEVTATVMDLNTHSEVIDKLQNIRKSVRVFYSETAAINSASYMDDTFAVYESLYFNGSPIGFATEKIIKNQPHTTWDAIVIYNTPKVTVEEFNAVQTYLNNGGTVIIDNLSLKKNEYGANLSSSLNAGSGSLIAASNLADLTSKSLNVLSTKNQLSPVTVVETNGLGANMNGVFWRAYASTSGIEKVTSLVNVGKTNATVTVGIRGTTDELVVFDMLTGEKLPSTTFTINSEETRLLKLMKKTDLGTEVFDENENLSFLYPNPTSGSFTISFKSNKTADLIDVEVYTILGKRISKESFEPTTSISCSVENYPAGVYVVNVKRGKEVSSFKVLRK